MRFSINLHLDENKDTGSITIIGPSIGTISCSDLSLEAWMKVYARLCLVATRADKVDYFTSMLRDARFFDSIRDHCSRQNVVRKIATGSTSK